MSSMSEMITRVKVICVDADQELIDEIPMLIQRLARS
jgi:hypothetical protein